MGSGWSTSNACVFFHLSVASFHIAFASGDKLLHKFWEVEESPRNCSNLSSKQRAVVYFNDNYTRANSGSFIVPLPKNPQAKPLSESRSQAVRRFLSLEHARCMD